MRLKVGRSNKMATGGGPSAQRLLIASPNPPHTALRTPFDINEEIHKRLAIHEKIVPPTGDLAPNTF
jgi:hypothetical protein